MKRLILVRHAKSDWSLGMADHDRPLNVRGRASAAAIGRWLREKNLRPDQVLCSTATRTRETLDLLDLDAPPVSRTGSITPRQRSCCPACRRRGAMWC